MADEIEQSWPVEGKALPGAQWSPMMLGLGSGILDQGGFPYRLIFASDANATNEGILKCPTIEGKAYGAAIVSGFFHKYTADMKLEFPAVTKTTTYYVVLQFVPNRVTEGGLPVKVEVVTSLDRTQGKEYLHLWNVTRRANELLTDATVRMIRPRVAPQIVFASEDDMPEPNKVLWGTEATVHGGRNSNRTKKFMAMTGDDGESTTGWFWKLVYDQSIPEWVTLGDTGNTTWAGTGARKSVKRVDGVCKLQGRLVRPDGSVYSSSSASGYLIANLSGTYAPAETKEFPVYISGGGRAHVAINYSESEARLWVDEGSGSIVDLGTLEYNARS